MVGPTGTELKCKKSIYSKLPRWLQIPAGHVEVRMMTSPDFPDFDEIWSDLTIRNTTLDYNIFFSVWLRKLSIESFFKVFCRGWGSDVITIFFNLAMTCMIFNLLFQTIPPLIWMGFQLKFKSHKRSNTFLLLSKAIFVTLDRMLISEVKQETGIWRKISPLSKSK